MIDLQALKAQLAALGHNLPEDQVISILKDMQLDFTKDGSAPGAENI